MDLRTRNALILSGLIVFGWAAWFFFAFYAPNYTPKGIEDLQQSSQTSYEAIAVITIPPLLLLALSFYLWRTGLLLKRLSGAPSSVVVITVARVTFLIGIFVCAFLILRLWMFFEGGNLRANV